MFLITGTGLERHDSDCRCGRALVNPVQLRDALNCLQRVAEMLLGSQKGFPSTIKGAVKVDLLQPVFQLLHSGENRRLVEHVALDRKTRPFFLGFVQTVR